MAKKESKVSINSVDKYLKARNMEPYAVTMECNGCELQFTVKRSLNWDDMMTMVYSAVNAVFFDEDGETIYHPEFEEIAMASAVLTFVANFKEDMSMGLVHELMYAGVLDKIKELWNTQQNYDFVDQFRRMVDHREAMLVAGERDKLMKISDKLDKASETMKIIADTFGDVSAEQLQEAVNAMAGMDAMTLANAVIDARDKDFIDQRRAQLEVVISEY